MPGLPTVFDKYFTNNAVEEGDVEKYHMGCHPRTGRKEKKKKIKKLDLIQVWSQTSVYMEASLALLWSRASSFPAFITR